MRLQKPLILLGAILFLAVGCTPTGRSSSSMRLPTPADQSSTPSDQSNEGVPRVSHVWLFVLENSSYSRVIGNPFAPFLNRLARTYAVTTAMYAVTHPSLPDYLTLVAGSTLGCHTDQCRGGYTEPMLADQLEQAGISWRAYLECLPHVAYVGDDTDGDQCPYVRHHDPFVYFRQMTDRAPMRRLLRPLGELLPSLSDPPGFSFVVPSNLHNMHTGSVSQSDRWLKSYITPILGSQAFKSSGLVLITWDESHHTDGSGCCLPSIAGGRIPTIAIASAGKRHLSDPTRYTTYSLLRTIEDVFGLDHLGKANDPRVKPLTNIWP